MSVERGERLISIAHVYLDKVQKSSSGSVDLKDLLKGCPFHEKFESCGNSGTCQCLPHVCFTSFKKLRLRLSQHLEQALNASNEILVVFANNCNGVGRNNPLFRSLIDLGYSLDYIKEWLSGCTYEMLIKKNLDFIIHIDSLTTRATVAWTNEVYNSMNDEQRTKMLHDTLAVWFMDGSNS